MFRVHVELGGKALSRTVGIAAFSLLAISLLGLGFGLSLIVFGSGIL